MSRHVDYYQKTKEDPEKLTALRARRAKNQRERRAKLNRRSQQECSQQNPSVLTTQTKPVVTHFPLKSLKQLLDDPVVSDSVVSNAEPDPVVIDLDYEERAAIMEYDGGLTRVEAEFEAAIRSTVPLVPVVSTPVASPLVVSSLGGKHAATAAQGDIGLTADQIMEIWRRHWGA